jgi:HAD superfamily hydrolase (TIGR01509 family)
MKKYILWDNDGVLVDTEWWYFKATQRALSELGIVLEEGTYLKRMVAGESSWGLALAAGVDADQVAIKQQHRDSYYQESLARENIDIPDVERVLALLSKTYKMATVTTSKRSDFELIHKSRNLVRHMDFVLTREDYISSKPDPEPYLLALRRFGAIAEDCLVIEDSQRGLQSAIAAGIDCAIVYNKFTSKHDFTGASHLLDSIGDLPGIIDV